MSLGAVVRSSKSPVCRKAGGSRRWTRVLVGAGLVTLVACAPASTDMSGDSQGSGGKGGSSGGAGKGGSGSGGSAGQNGGGQGGGSDSLGGSSGSNGGGGSSPSGGKGGGDNGGSGGSASGGRGGATGSGGSTSNGGAMGSGGMTGKGGSPGTADGGADAPSNVPSFAMIRDIALANCVACHPGETATPTRDDFANGDELYKNLTATMSPYVVKLFPKCQFKRLVTPGDPAHSLLYLKMVTPLPADCGEQMPKGKKAEPDSAALIKAWIEGGAPMQ